QEVPTQITRPHSRIAHLPESLTNMGNHMVEKGSGTCGRVKDQHMWRFFYLLLAMFISIGVGHGSSISKPIRTVEVLTQQVIYRANNVRYYRLRSIVNTAQLTHFWVILCQEGFIEVDNGILLAGVFAKVSQDSLHVSKSEHL